MFEAYRRDCTHLVIGQDGLMLCSLIALLRGNRGVENVPAIASPKIR